MTITGFRTYFLVNDKNIFKTAKIRVYTLQCVDVYGSNDI